MTMTEVAFALIAAPLVVFVLFKAAATGWYSVKLRYHRRLIRLARGDRDGQQTGQ